MSFLNITLVWEVYILKYALVARLRAAPKEVYPLAVLG